MADKRLKHNTCKAIKPIKPLKNNGNNNHKSNIIKINQTRYCTYIKIPTNMKY